jgi:hypothetical protein
MPDINDKKKKIVVDPNILFGGDSKNSKSAANQTPFQKRKA